MKWLNCNIPEGFVQDPASKVPQTNSIGKQRRFSWPSEKRWGKKDSMTTRHKIRNIRSNWQKIHNHVHFSISYLPQVFVWKSTSICLSTDVYMKTRAFYSYQPSMKKWSTIIAPMEARKMKILWTHEGRTYNEHWWNSEFMSWKGLISI